MKVRELIAKLHEFDPEMPVVFATESNYSVINPTVERLYLANGMYTEWSRRHAEQQEVVVL